jgi:hypothetical protein
MLQEAILEFVWFARAKYKLLIKLNFKLEQKVISVAIASPSDLSEVWIGL